MRYIIPLFAMAVCLFVSTSSHANRSKSEVAPEKKAIRTQFCYDSNDDFVSIGNTCVIGSGSCVPNPCYASE